MVGVQVRETRSSRVQNPEDGADFELGKGAVVV